MAIIEPNLNATLMRNQMETKNELSAKGSLYVGTGNTTPVEYIGADGTTATTNVPVTTHIAPNVDEDDGKVLIADSAKLEGWKIDKIGNDNITNGAITGDKLAENFTYLTSDTGSFCLQDSSNNSTPRLSFVESNNHASVALQADLKSQELEGESYTLTLPNENGTVATKEQIENGDIIAKSASYASTANATTINGKGISEIFNSDGTTVKKAEVAEVAQATGFTNQNWNIVTSGSSEVEVRDSALYEILVDGLFIVVGGGVSTNRGRAFDIITTELSGSTVLKYFDVYDATISSIEYTSYLMVAKTRYEAKNLGGYMHWELGTRTQITDFRYRRIA